MELPPQWGKKYEKESNKKQVVLVGFESEKGVFYQCGQGSLYGISIDLNKVNELERFDMLEEQQCELAEWL